MKKIALDVDGVIFDSENLYRVYSEIYDIDINNKDTVIDNSKRTFQKRYKWKEQDFIDFYNKFSNEIINNANFMPGFDIVINKLKNNYEFIIVTARNDVETQIALSKLKSIGLDIKAFNNEFDKLDRFLKEDVDFIIDDDDEICINAASNNIKAFYLKNNASNKVFHNNVINVNNWGEIYKWIILNDK